MSKVTTEMLDPDGTCRLLHGALAMNCAAADRRVTALSARSRARPTSCARTSETRRAARVPPCAARWADFSSQVCLAIRTMAPLVEGLSVRRLPLLETLQVLGCAPRICAAVGTFAKIWTSHHNHNTTHPGRWDVRFPAAPASSPQMPTPDPHNGEVWPGRNMTRTWQNTCLQREGMLL